MTQITHEKDAGFDMRDIDPGRYIFQDGDRGDCAYLIKSGHVQILKEVDGKMLTLAVLKRGDILGEMALIDDQPRSAHAKAIDNVKLAIIPREEITSRLKRLEVEDPVIRRLISILTDRVRCKNMANEKLASARQRREEARAAKIRRTLDRTPEPQPAKKLQSATAS